MSALSDAFLTKAQESLAGAVSEFEAGRYNNAANRSYYACFQAAIAALDLAGIRPLGGKSGWGHEFVQSQFAGVLINRRKRYPSGMRDTLAQTISLRKQADYGQANVTQTQTARGLARTRALITAVMAQEGPTR